MSRFVIDLLHTRVVNLRKVGLIDMRARVLLLLVSASAFGQTPTSGPSWLERSHRTMGETSMGRSSRELGPSPSENAHPIQLGPVAPIVTLKGADLYRLKCQSCHGEKGEGAPPEINSIIDPVRATSATVILERMKKNGANMSRKDASALASQSEAALLDRLRKGGKNMPNPALSDAEIRVLMPYLELLAGLPAKQISIQESAVRIGEHLVKSTCHICHAAVGPNPTPEQIAAGAIPPLSMLTSRTSLEQFASKVTQGASVTIGPLSLPARGRMPVFNYISETEAAAAYFYLLAYPPQLEDENPNSHPANGKR
jgi:mono/diheme cytochrome c family protein